MHTTQRQFHCQLEMCTPTQQPFQLKKSINNKLSRQFLSTPTATRCTKQLLFAVSHINTQWLVCVEQVLIPKVSIVLDKLFSCI